MAESRTLGVFNATGLDQALTMGSTLTEIGQGTGIVLHLVCAPTAFLMKAKFRPGATCLSGYPVRRETFGFHHRDIYQAIAAGLTYRPLPLIAGDTLDWLRTLPPERQVMLPAGLAPEREADLLAKLAA